MINNLKKIKYSLIFVICTAASIVVFLLGDIAGFLIYDKKVKNGQVPQQKFTVSDFDLNSLKNTDGFLAATDSDPQMIICVKSEVYGISFKMKTILHPGPVVLYITEKAGEEFSESKKYIAYTADGENYSVRIDKYVEKLRIDPTIFAGNRVDFASAYINYPLKLKDFIKFDFTELFSTLAISRILSRSIKTAIDIAYENKSLKEKRIKKEGDGKC